MMTRDAFTDRLSDYVDSVDSNDAVDCNDGVDGNDGDAMTAAERADVAAHLETCAACRETLADLQEVARRAAALTSSPPNADLWPGIARRIAAVPRRSWRITFTLPQLAAAALALMVLSGSAVWLARLGGPGTDFPPLDARSQTAAPAEQPIDVRPANFADDRYDAAIADLRKSLDAGRSHLDPQTIRVLEDNLRSIDRAIEQCRQALEADPANVYLNGHLAEARRRKLTLLRRASALAHNEG